jgi:two-component system cell cycle response regulator DivK
MKAKILFVDDDPTTLQLMVRVASFLGADSLTSVSPRAALALAAKEQPQLIMVDMQMRKMNGIQFVVNLRKNELTRKIPTVLISAEKKPGEVEQAKKVGANGFFLKPLSIDEMTRIIQHFIKPSEDTP